MFFIIYLCFICSISSSFPYFVRFFFWLVSFAETLTFFQYLFYALWKEQYHWLVDDLDLLGVQVCISLNKRIATNDTGKHYCIVLDTQQKDVNSVHSFKGGLCAVSIKCVKWTRDMEVTLSTFMRTSSSKLSNSFDEICVYAGIFLLDWLTDRPTNSMEQSPSWGSNSSLASQ